MKNIVSLHGQNYWGKHNLAACKVLVLNRLQIEKNWLSVVFLETTKTKKPVNR